MDKKIDIDKWLDLLMDKLKKSFGSRLIFVGHIGSWVRGEATSSSDIDVNVILDNIDFNDIITYKRIIKEMPHSNLACGFICSTEEIKAWPSHELVQFIYGCQVLHGNIYDLVSNPNESDLREHIKISSAMIVEVVRHSFIYGPDIKKDVHNLSHAYKSSFFILQAWMLLFKREYILTKKEMLSILENDDKEILDININWSKLEKDREERPEYYFEILEKWGSKMLKGVS